jgi:nucleotide-binding universal stress UspA family protein
MKTILIPIDFSENAQHAAIYAATLSKVLNANIVLLNVYSTPYISEFENSSEIETKIVNSKISAEERMQNFVNTFLENTQLPVERVDQKVEFGILEEKIIETANSIKADYIVMGSKGASNAIDKWLGTNAQKVMEKAECPVWIIPADAEINAPSDIMYAADFKEDEISATHKIVDIANALGASCNVIHVHEYYELNVGHVVEVTEKELKAEFKNDDVTIRHITRTDITKGLDKYIETHKPDVLAMAIHDKSIFTKLFDSGISEHFIFGLKLPIITFKK